LSAKLKSAIGRRRKGGERLQANELSLRDRVRLSLAEDEPATEVPVLTLPFTGDAQSILSAEHRLEYKKSGGKQ
jgi:hypothetical protein